jgi:NAD(P)-dependent dehydrogenase (short-subunit alcohol dehydrogenase family)
MTEARRGAVMITGTSSGIGEDAALYFNERGYTVFAGVRRLEDGERVRQKATRPDHFHPVVIDVTDNDQVAAGRDLVTRRLGEEGLTALVSNAGIAAFNGDASCEACPIETQQRVMDVNHFGAVRVIQAFLPQLRRSRGTVVINSALMAHTVIPFSAGYAMSKSALECWADSLRREVASSGVRVAIIQAADISSALAGKQDYTSVPSDSPYPVQAAFLHLAGQMQERFAGNRRSSPRRVTELMVQAVESPRPRPRRITGGGSRPIWLIGLLPDSIQDTIFKAGLSLIARRAAPAQPSVPPSPGSDQPLDILWP